MKKILLLIIITLTTLIMFGCSKSQIDMSYLKTPSSIELIDNKNSEINSIKQDLKNLNNNDTKNEDLRNKLLSNLYTSTNKFTVKTNDEEFITKIFNKIKISSGISINDGTKYESNNIIYNLHLNYSDVKITEDNMEDLIKDGYVFDVWIFEDKTAVTAKYDSNKLISVGVTLDNETFDYIKEYYNTGILK